MKYGFTGSQRGMTKLQANNLGYQFIYGPRVDELHHGDCIGADAMAHNVGLVLATRVVIHPPTDPKKRAFCTGHSVIILQPFPYLARNKHIVDGTDRLIATPMDMEMQLRSGTWSTVRYALKVDKPVLVILPDGTIWSKSTLELGK